MRNGVSLKIPNMILFEDFEWVIFSVRTYTAHIIYFDCYSIGILLCTIHVRCEFRKKCRVPLLYYSRYFTCSDEHWYTSWYKCLWMRYGLARLQREDATRSFRPYVPKVYQEILHLNVLSCLARYRIIYPRTDKKKSITSTNVLQYHNIMLRVGITI